MDIENLHSANSTVVIAADEHHGWRLKLMSEAMMRGRIFSYFNMKFTNYKRKHSAFTLVGRLHSSCLLGPPRSAFVCSRLCITSPVAALQPSPAKCHWSFAIQIPLRSSRSSEKVESQDLCICSLFWDYTSLFCLHTHSFCLQALAQTTPAPKSSLNT